MLHLSICLGYAAETKLLCGHVLYSNSVVFSFYKKKKLETEQNSSPDKNLKFGSIKVLLKLC